MNFARFAVAVVCAATLGPATVAGAEKTLTAERFQVRIVAARDGTMRVVETVTFRFEGGPFTSLTRVLPTRNTDGIDDVGASLDGVPFPAGRQAGQAQIKRENGITVTWRFAPVSDTTRTATLTYRVRGAIRHSSTSDTLVWRAVPARRSYAVRDVAVRVEWPDGGTLTGGSSAPVGAGLNAGDWNGVTLAPVGDLASDTPFDVALEFAPGTVTSVTPTWQERHERGMAAAPGLGIAAGAILFSGLCWLGVFLVSHRREPLTAEADSRQAAPPDALPVAMAAALLESGARPAWNHALATLVDLARRGVVRIEEDPHRTWQGSREYVIHQAGARTGLAPHESGVLDLLFASKDGPVNSVKLSAVARAVQSRFKVFTLPLDDALVAEGLIAPDRAQTRAALVRWAVLLVVASALGFIAAVPLVSSLAGWPLLVPGSILAVALALLVTASQFSVLSTAGYVRAGRWRRFFAFLQHLAAGRDAIADPSWFEHYLPYAVARGIGHRWVRKFEKAGGLVAAPPWFKAADAPLGARTPAQALADMLVRARAAGAPKHAGT